MTTKTLAFHLFSTWLVLLLVGCADPAAQAPGAAESTGAAENGVADDARPRVVLAAFQMRRASAGEAP